ncbi:MAG TPA: HAD-IIA family hydrolase [Acidimicrobiales bacterium]|nr:HAD-IIA family hydrolase [Acidimicrobiales bacterium]
MTTWILDLDGVLWLGDDPIPGAADAITRMRDRRDRVLFVSNNSSARVDEYLAKLERVGVPTESADLVTSGQAAATLLEPGQTALVCAGPGVVEALEARAVRTVRDGPADAVVVGWHRDFDYDELTRAAQAVMGGARLIGTNDDATYPTPHGPIPGGGAILAAVATAAGVDPTVAGKPHAPMVELVRARLGRDLDGATVVGDRPSTDGLLAVALGVRFALVLSGVTTERDLPVDPQPAEVAADLASLVR